MNINVLSKIAIPVITMTLLVGCGDMHKSHAEQATEHQHATAQHADAATASLQLDHGVKWRLDEHTRAQFQIMHERLSSATSGKELGSKLQHDVEQLIAGCTMTGDAHQQLHVFLAQFMPAVNALQETGDAADETQVKTLLAQYPQYFE